MCAPICNSALICGFFREVWYEEERFAATTSKQPFRVVKAAVLHIVSVKDKICVIIYYRDRNKDKIPFCRTGMLTHSVLLLRGLCVCRCDRVSLSVIITDVCVCPGTASLQTGTPSWHHDSLQQPVFSSKEKNFRKCLKVRENRHSSGDIKKCWYQTLTVDLVPGACFLSLSFSFTLTLPLSLSVSPC